MSELDKALMLVERLRKHRDFSYLTLREIIASEDHDEARMVASRAAKYLESEWVDTGRDGPPRSRL